MKPSFSRLNDDFQRLRVRSTAEGVVGLHDLVERANSFGLGRYRQGLSWRFPLQSLLHQQYRNNAVCNHALRNATHQRPANPAVAVGAHHDEFNLFVFRRANNLFHG